ncbi:MAG: hypothetical protein IJH86_01990 [Clostridia bacterium]|nr:hypothetical protein [Clostridia bacterium]
MSDFCGIREPDRRVMVVTGHYGSGKTEFSVSLAMLLAKKGLGPYARLGLCDLDIINPYFRSRERRAMLEAAGIPVYGSAYQHDVTAELPELSADVRAPLEDKGCRVIVDLGGNDSGAIVLNQFSNNFSREETLTLIVINANRPETRDLDGAMTHLQAIERATGLHVDGLINNTHLLRETDAACIEKGHRLCERICAETGRFIWCDCYPAGIVPEADIEGRYEHLMPMGLYMRPGWLDR